MQRQCSNKLCRSAWSPNTLFVLHQRQIEVPAHIVMEDMSNWLLACSSNTLGEKQWMDEIKADEDPANLTILMEEDGAGCSLDAQFGEKQTTSLMCSDMTLAAPLRLIMKLKKE